MKEIPLSLSGCGKSGGCSNPARFIETYISERASQIQVPWCADHAPKPSLTPNQTKWLAECNLAGFDPVLELQKLRDQVALLSKPKRSTKATAQKKGPASDA